MHKNLCLKVSRAQKRNYGSISQIPSFNKENRLTF